MTQLEFFNEVSIFDTPEEKFVRRITPEEAYPFLFNIHYARRKPCITDAFGLFVNGELVGVVTYGIPASMPLCIGLAGRQNQYNVKELNRLCLLPNYNASGGGEIMRLISFLILLKCSTITHSLSVMLILHGLMSAISIKPVISCIQGCRRSGRIHISRKENTRALMTKTITPILCKPEAENTDMFTLSGASAKKRKCEPRCCIPFCRIPKGMRGNTISAIPSRRKESKC